MEPRIVSVVITTKILLSVPRKNYPSGYTLQDVLEEETRNAEDVLIDTLFNNGIDEINVTVSENNEKLTKVIYNDKSEVPAD